MDKIEIESKDVIRLIQQFLKENHLLNTLKSLEEETQVTLNTVEDVNKLKNSIIKGEWDLVLNILKPLTLPPATLVDLYEQIVLDLIELKEIGAARSLLRQSDPMNNLRESDQDRYLNLEGFLSRTEFSYHMYLPSGTTKEMKRTSIAEDLSREVINVPPSRLLTLLNQSIVYQVQQGLINADQPYDLFQGDTKFQQTGRDEMIGNLLSTIKFPKGHHPECSKFSSTQNSIITGSGDGLIEVWNGFNGKLRKDLSYQANKQFMVMGEAVLTLALSVDGELLVTGSKSGDITVWKMSTGAPIKFFPQAHSDGVSTVEFSKTHSNTILSGGFDGVVKTFGMKSGKKLKELRGHSSFINHALFMRDDTMVVSASSDGSVKFWDVKTTQCLYSYNYANFASTQPLSTISIQHLAPVPKSQDQLLVTSKSNTLHIINSKGHLLNTFIRPTPKKVEPKQEELGAKKFEVEKETYFVMGAISCQGDFVYGLHDDGNLYCFATSTGDCKSTFKVTDGEPIGLHHHPQQNILATFSTENLVKLWKS